MSWNGHIDFLIKIFDAQLIVLYSHVIVTTILVTSPCNMTKEAYGLGQIY